VKAGVLGEITLPGVERSVPVIRHCVAAMLSAAGHADADDVLLVASELVSNAVVHSRSSQANGRVTVVIADVGGQAVHIEVIDEGSDGLPRAREADPHSGGGRGLFLVEHVSAKWGIREMDAGRMAVWAEVTTYAASG
jgi:anti-sigma regulatory factor (Ser/Thr protein kinase)